MAFFRDPADVVHFRTVTLFQLFAQGVCFGVAENLVTELS